jgi:hypothetical protein
LIDWLKLLLVGKVSADDLNDLNKINEIPPFLGALLKNESDYDLYKALREKGIK